MKTHENLVAEFKELSTKLFTISREASHFETSIEMHLLGQAVVNCYEMIDAILEDFEEE